MIHNHDEYVQAHETLRDVGEALAALRHRLGERRQALFAAMAQDYLTTLSSLRRDIDEYIGVRLVEGARAPLWLGLEGGNLSPSNIRTSLLAGWLERFRKSLAGVVAIKALGRAAGRIPDVISEACDFRLVAFQSGSLRVGLELPGPEQPALFEDVGADSTRAAQEGLRELLEGAAVVADIGGQAERAWTEADLRLTAERRQLFKQVLRIIPGARERVTAVVLDGTLLPRPNAIRLDSRTRAALAGLLGGEAELDRIEEFEGSLREIDLDRQKFIIRERPDNEPDVTVYFGAEQIEDAKRALASRVRVEASRGRGPQGRLRVLVIEVIDESMR